MWLFIFSFKFKNDDYCKCWWCEFWEEFVLLVGEVEIWQGEVLWIIVNVEDEVNWNGFVNWDEEDDCDIDFFVDYLCGGLIFDFVMKERVCGCVVKIKVVGGDMKLLVLMDVEWNFMYFCVVDWCDVYLDLILVCEDSGYLGYD